MKNENKYVEKWYSRYLMLAIGCIVLNFITIIMLIYFLMIDKLFDKVVICFFLVMCLFFSNATIFAVIKSKQIKKEINKPD